MAARSALLMGLAVALSPRARAAEWQPVVRLDASVGQVFFSDSVEHDRALSNTGGLSGDWLLAEGISFSSGNALIPQLTGSFARRDQPTAVGGGSIQISQTLDNTAALRWVYALGDWKLKPNASYKSELLDRGSTEALGDGLFDLRQEQAGLEAEWSGDRLKSLRQSLSAAQTQYYHYDPARSPLFGSELLNDRRNLDFVSYTYRITAEYRSWKDGLITATGDLSLLEYAHQPVFEGGAPTASQRQDWLGDGFLSVGQRWRTAAGELSLSVTAGFSELGSDQNNFDNNQSGAGIFANSDYYSYDEYSAGPTLGLAFGGRWKTTLSYNYARRVYRDRPAQDPFGNYEAQRVWTQTHTLAGSVVYALGGRWSASASAGYTRSISNSAFESFYLYGYSYPYYFLGLGYSL